MGKIKSWYRSIPLWLAIFLFAAAALIGSSFVSGKITSAAYSEMMKIGIKYMRIVADEEQNDDYSTYYSADKDGGEDIVFYQMDYYGMTEDDSHRYDFYQLVAKWGPFVIYSAGLLAAALLFYFSKLKKPLKILQNASIKIAENELDFSLDYAGHDEMANLCRAFEKMRSALDENNLRMLRMIDERQQLNDAYTHDLRTPIAVLKGYTDMLGKYLPEKRMSDEEVIETVRTMSSHVSRLEQFVNSMNTAQRIADLTVSREHVPAEDFVCGLLETAEFLCAEKGILCRSELNLEGGTLNIDPSVVTQVFENLLSNSVRFAKSEILIRIECGEREFSIYIRDDGEGFSGKELLTASKPYYRGAQEKETYHFGLGLFICRTLCEKHGGSLKLANADDGGAAVTALFRM